MCSHRGFPSCRKEQGREAFVAVGCQFPRQWVCEVSPQPSTEPPHVEGEGGGNESPVADAGEAEGQDAASNLADRLASAGPSGEELAALPTAKAASQFFMALDKAVRGTRLYQGEGDVVRRMMEALVARGVALVSDDEVTVSLRSVGLSYEGEPITEAGVRIQYLFQLYCDGVREITLTPGLDAEELLKLVDVLKTEPAKLVEDDMVTLLWRQDLEHVRYYAVDGLGAGEAADDSGLAGGSRAQLDRDAAGDIELAMTSGDLRNLRTDDLMEWVRETSCDASPVGAEQAVADRVSAAYTRQSDHGRFLDVAVQAAARGKRGSSATMAVGVYDAALLNADIDGVLAMLGWVVDHIGDEEPSVVSLQTALVAPERFARLGPLYLSHPDALQPILQRLVVVAQGAMVAMFKTLRPGDAANALQSMLGEAGVDLTDYYLDQLDGDDEKILLNAIGALGRIGSPDALRAVAKGLTGTLSSVRAAALKALDGRYDEAYRVELGRVLRDPEKENRVIALKILAKSGDRRMCWPILGIAQSRGFDRLAVDEQAAVYHALGAFQDNRNLEHFEAVLSNKNLMRNKAARGRQMMTVEALAATGTAEAKALAEKYADKWFVAGDVKQALKLALSKWRSGA